MTKLKLFGWRLLQGLLETGAVIAILLGLIFAVEVVLYSGFSGFFRATFAAVIIFAVWAFGWKLD